MTSMQPHKDVVPQRPFLPEEDAGLIHILTSTPFFSWDSAAEQFPGRTGRQCGERLLHHGDQME